MPTDNCSFLLSFSINDILNGLSSPLMLIEKNFDNVKVNEITNKDEEILRSNWDGTFLVNDTEILDDEKEKFKLIERIEKDELPSNELVDFIENIRPKSDWDRLFLPQIGEISNIEESIDKLRKLRNKVAHCKFFRKVHYEETESFKQITSSVTLPITDMLKKFKENMLLTSIDYNDTDYKNKKKGIKKLENKKFIKKL